MNHADRIKKLFQEDDIVFFVGAGISMWHPTNIPNGYEINRNIIESLYENLTFNTISKFKQKYFENLMKPIADIITRQSTNSELIPLERTFSLLYSVLQKEELQKRDNFFISMKWFSRVSLSCIHESILRIAYHTQHKLIITPNIDCAFHQNTNIPVQYFTKDNIEEIQNPQYAHCVKIVYVHGIVKKPEIVVFSIEREIQGLDNKIQDFLLTLSNCKIILMGYSASDFDIYPILKQNKNVEYYSLDKSNTNKKLVDIARRKENFLTLDIPSFFEQWSLENYSYANKISNFKEKSRQIRAQKCKDIKNYWTANLSNYQRLHALLEILLACNQTPAVSKIIRQLLKTQHFEQYPILYRLYADLLCDQGKLLYALKNYYKAYVKIHSSIYPYEKIYALQMVTSCYLRLREFAKAEKILTSKSMKLLLKDELLCDQERKAIALNDELTSKCKIYKNAPSDKKQKSFSRQFYSKSKACGDPERIIEASIYEIRENFSYSDQSLSKINKLIEEAMALGNSIFVQNLLREKSSILLRSNKKNRYKKVKFYQRQILRLTKNQITEIKALFLLSFSLWKTKNYIQSVYYFMLLTLKVLKSILLHELTAHFFIYEYRRYQEKIRP